LAGVAAMRRIVIGKMLIVVLWLLYLVVGLTQPSGNGGSANGVAGTSRCSQQPPTDMTRGGHFASPRGFRSTFSLAREAFVPTPRSADYALAPARRTAQARPHRCRIPLDN